MKITRAGFGLISLVVMGVILAFTLLGASDAMTLIAMMVTAFVLSFLYVLFSKPKVKVKRKTDPVKLRAGLSSQLILELQNPMKRSTPIIYGIDQIAGKKNTRLTFGSIRSSESIKIGYSTPELKRGVLEVGPLKLTLQDPLGLVERKIKADSAVSYLVRPKLYELLPVTAASGRLKTTHKKARRNKSGDEEFYALRPYVLGDDLRKVHWRAAAKKDDLLIRQDTETQLGAVTIALDVNSHNHNRDSFERAISATASILHSAYKGGDLVKYFSSDSPKSQVVENNNDIDSIEKELSLLQPDSIANLSRILDPLSRRSVGGTLIVIIGSATDEIARVIDNCRLRHRQIIVICCNTPTNARWVIPYDGESPLPVIWQKALAVSTK